MRSVILYSISIFFFLFFIISCGDETSSNQVAGDLDESLNDEGFQAADDNYETVDTIVENDSMAETEDSSPDEDMVESVVFNQPDPDYELPPVALIVTSEEFSEIFRDYAAFHTVSGIRTKVATVENICASDVCDEKDSKIDTARAIKKYVTLIPGLKYLIIGGDIEIIPSRKVHDKYSNLMAGTFEDDFQTDFYYADFSDWDSNNNGIYAEDSDLIDYFPEIAVGRISISTIEEAQRYFDKMVAHNTRYNTMDVKKSLLLANVATNFSGIDINAGYYFETEGRTSDIIPMDFSKKKLYANTIPAPAKDAAILDNEKQKKAMEEGVNIIVHNGHGYPSLLSCEQVGNDNDFTGEMAYALKNTTYPIFLSCACQAGQFEAPFTYSYVNSSGQTVSKIFKSDSAGEMLVNAPLGGAVAYLGNTITGLGIAGGSQFIDEMLRNMFLSSSSPLGDSYMAAHFALKKQDTFSPPVPMVPSVPVVDEDSWKWTKKSVVMIGSPLVTFWRDPFPFINSSIGISAKKVQGGYSITLNIPSDFAGFDIKIFANDNLYTIQSVTGGNETIGIAGEISNLFFGISKTGAQPFFQKSGI